MQSQARPGKSHLGMGVSDLQSLIETDPVLSGSGVKAVDLVKTAWSGVEAGGQRPGYAEAGGQNRQIAYSGALRTAPARRRLPQVRNNEYHSRSVVGHWDVDQ